MSEKPYPYNEDQLAWLRDLETTEEPQTVGFLHRIEADMGDRDQTGYCCLGRACVIFGCAETSEHGVGYFNRNYDRLLPKTVSDRLRLRSNNGELEFADESSVKLLSSLTMMNDAGWSFKKIAAYIRANPWNVFRDPEEPS